MTHDDYIGDATVLLHRLSQQPESVKRKALQIYICSRLQNCSLHESKLFLAELATQDNVSAETLEKSLQEFENSPVRIRHQVRERLQRLIKLLHLQINPAEDINQTLDRVVAQVDHITQRLSEITSRYEKFGDIEKALNEIDQSPDQQLQAMYNTVQAIMARTIESLDPEKSENYLDNSVMKVGPLKKAAMFDAVKEKYAQVRDYNNEGKMLRDYKVLYKQELKKQKKDG